MPARGEIFRGHYTIRRAGRSYTVQSIVIIYVGIVTAAVQCKVLLISGRADGRSRMAGQ